MKFNDIKRFLEEHISNIKIIKFNKDGAVIEVDYLKMKPKVNTWKDITLYTFTVQSQKVEDKTDLQLVFH